MADRASGRCKKGAAAVSPEHSIDHRRASRCSVGVISPKCLSRAARIAVGSDIHQKGGRRAACCGEIGHHACFLACRVVVEHHIHQRGAGRAAALRFVVHGAAGKGRVALEEDIGQRGAAGPAGAAIDNGAAATRYPVAAEGQIGQAGAAHATVLAITVQPSAVISIACGNHKAIEAGRPCDRGAACTVQGNDMSSIAADNRCGRLRNRVAIRIGIVVVDIPRQNGDIGSPVALAQAAFRAVEAAIHLHAGRNRKTAGWGAARFVDARSDPDLCALPRCAQRCGQTVVGIGPTGAIAAACCLAVHIDWRNNYQSRRGCRAAYTVDGGEGHRVTAK